VPAAIPIGAALEELLTHLQSPVAITSLLEEMGVDEGPSVDDMFAEGQADDNSQVGSSSTVSFVGT